MRKVVLTGLAVFLVGIAIASSELGSSIHSSKNTSNPSNVLYENTNYSVLGYLWANSIADCPPGFTYNSGGKYCVTDGAGLRGWEIIDFGSSKYTYNISLNASDFDIGCCCGYCDYYSYPYVEVFVTNNSTLDASTEWHFIGSSGGLNDLSYQLVDIVANQNVRYVILGRDGAGDASSDPAVHWVKRVVYDDPVASATSSVTTGLEQLSVNFSGSVSGGEAPYSYYWDFGDGSNSSSQNPSHTFVNDGVYTVVLTVSDGMSNSDNDTVSITVNNNIPTATAGASDTNPVEGMNVSFTGSVSNGNSPFTYFWNFSDGYTSTSQNPVHSFASAGAYNVSFKVTDYDGDYDTGYVLVNVQTDYPVYSLPYADNYTVVPYQNVTFFGNYSLGNDPVTFFWNFTDGSTSTLENPVHFFSSEGYYSVSLKVTDKDGDFNTGYVNINVTGI